MRRSRNPRSCVACKRERPPREMLRVERTPEGEATLDEAGRLSGRGAYVCPEPQCVALCLKKRLLEKSLKCEIPEAVRTRLKELAHVDEESVALAENALNDEVCSTLSLAHRAGELLIGQDRVLDAITAGQTLLVVLSCDYSETLMRSLVLKGTAPRIMTEVSRLELGRLLGRRQAQIAALPAKSGFAKKLEELLPEEGGNAVE